MSIPHSQCGGGRKEKKILPISENQTPIIQLITDPFTLYYSSHEIKFNRRKYWFWRLIV
jgi:hypothetical protein